MKISDLQFDKVSTTQEEIFDPTSLTDFLNYIKSKGYLVDFSDEKNMKHWINEFQEYVANRKT